MAVSREALVVFAHPSPNSLCAHLADVARGALATAGAEVRVLDLYGAGFDPVMTTAERAAYNSADFAGQAPAELYQGLREAETLVLVFPAWWFGMPAILKGYIDRVFAPGVAFDHGKDFGPIQPRLEKLREVVVVATFGTPWWVDRIVMRRPLRRVLRTGVFSACAPKASFTYVPFYLTENAGPERVGRFADRVRKTLAKTKA